MGGFVRKIAGKPKKDRYKATSMEKFQTKFASETIDRLNPMIGAVLNKVKEYSAQNFTGQGEGIANLDAMKVAKNMPGALGLGVQLGTGVGSILGQTMNVNNSADALIGNTSNISSGGTKGKMKGLEAQTTYLKGAAGETDTLMKGTMANVKLATSDLLGEASAKIKRDTAPLALINPLVNMGGQKFGSSKMTNMLGT